MENNKTKFHPMLYSTPMVQALLENRKKMTRRTKGLEKFNAAPDIWRYDGFDEEIKSHYMELISSDGKFTEKYFEVVCPYEVGDVFWVKENFYTASNWDHWKPSMLKSINVEVFYVADFSNHEVSRPLSKGKTRPCIFLPKEYARLFLKIKAIRVERLNTISNEDAIGEGINSEIFFLDNKISIYENYLPGKDFYDWGDYSWNFGKEIHSAPVASFCSLWESINVDGSWNSNPLVFVYEFEQIEKPLDFIV